MGATIRQHDLRDPPAPRVIMDDRSGPHTYAIVALGPFGKRSAASTAVRTQGLATLEWDSVVGADSYLVLRDDREIAGPLRIEGAAKRWTDPEKR